MRKSIFILLTLSILLLTGCARMGQPDGGWYDDTPPHVVASNPEDLSTNVRSRKITILFDEYIKLDNPTEKVVISPPQLEAPEIKGAGNRITVEIKDSLIPNTTYTVDFSDAISDNNEGNPMGNYTYSFSTGDVIDTLEVAGYVVDAETLEPIKGILVGLYDNLSDTAFTTLPMLRVARTNEEGRFIVKGVAPGSYRTYALQDVDANYFFSQKSEQLAFSPEVIVPSCKPDVRQDTIWRDSLHIDNITQTGYTHFLPDDIVLRAFTEPLTDRFLVKNERSIPERLSFFFSYGSSELPKIQGLNFDERDAFILESSEKGDTLNYWLRDTLLVNQDTLRMAFSYLFTDSTGMLVSHTDTLELLAKTSYEKRQKEKAKEYEKWVKAQEKARKKGNDYQEEMPPAPLEIKIDLKSDMQPDGFITITSPTPLLSVDTTKIHLSTKVDTLFQPKDYILADWTIVADTAMEAARRTYVLRPDSAGNLWTTGKQYSLELDSAAFIDIYGKASLATKKSLSVKPDEDFTTITFHVTKIDEAPYVGQLLDKSGKPVKEVLSSTGDLTFTYVRPGEYFLRLFSDANGNGIWDTGDYAEGLQAEMVYFYPEMFECKARWPFEANWNLSNVRADNLKPSELTKQKKDNKKRKMNRNIETARKMGITYIPQTQ